jgi:hypothetical protein
MVSGRACVRVRAGARSGSTTHLPPRVALDLGQRLDHQQAADAAAVQAQDAQAAAAVAAQRRLRARRGGGSRGSGAG